MRTRVKDGIEYVIAVRCPWCGQCTVHYNEKALKNMEHCPECDTEYLQGNFWFWVPKSRLGMNNKNVNNELKQ